MANRPKSLTVAELSSAVQEALQIVKIKPNPETGPWPWIGPILVGIIYRGPIAEIRTAGEAIAKQVSVRTQTPVTPVIEEIPGAAEGTKSFLPPNHVLTGFRPEKPILF